MKNIIAQFKNDFFNNTKTKSECFNTLMNHFNLSIVELSVIWNNLK